MRNELKAELYSQRQTWSAAGARGTGAISTPAQLAPTVYCPPTRLEACLAKTAPSVQSAR